jgi:hypothetical protein
MAAQLQLLVIDDGNLTDSSAVISETTPIDPRMSLMLLDEPNEQKRKWQIPLSGAKFWFDPTGDEANSVGFSKGAWRSFIRVELPGGKVIFLGERFTTPQ